MLVSTCLAVTLASQGIQNQSIAYRVYLSHRNHQQGYCSETRQFQQKTRRLDRPCPWTWSVSHFRLWGLELLRFGLGI